MLIVTEEWKQTYPGAATGILAMRNVANPAVHPALEEQKSQLEREIRARFSGADRAAIKALKTIAAYNDYYKKFKKTYHVQAQLESILFKDRSIPNVAALVEAMFMAEIKNIVGFIQS